MNRYLDMVDHPEHVRKLTLEQLEQLAQEYAELTRQIAGYELTGGNHLVNAIADHVRFWRCQLAQRS